MTVEDALAQASALLDDQLAARLEELALILISRTDPDVPPSADDAGPWRRVTLEEILARQRQADAVWKATALARLRAGLEAAIAQDAR